MEIYLPAETWFILSSILTPIGYVIQDVVADAMTVEAVESKGNKFDGKKIQKEMSICFFNYTEDFQLFLGSLLVGLINIYFFSGIKYMEKVDVLDAYSKIYFLSLFIPLLSISGVVLSSIFKKKFELKFNKLSDNNKLDFKIFMASIFFVFFAILFGSLKFPFSQEFVLVASLILIFFLMRYLVKPLSKEKKLTIIGTAIIIFVFRSIPGPGAGLTWFEIDILGFDQSFLSYLSVNAAFITLLGLFFKKIIIRASLAKIFIFMSLISGLLYIPSLSMYYGLHNFTAEITGGIVDARFIAFINTAVESPLGQVAMIPLLGWIAKNAPLKYKATFFAVFASFTNLALSARELFTKYLNSYFIIKREIVDDKNKSILESADYNSLDELLITLIIITIFVPILIILIVQKTKYKSLE